MAPVKIGEGAIVGAGSVVTKDVADDALAVTRAAQTEHKGWAVKFRARKSAEKLAAKAATPGKDKKPAPRAKGKGG